MQFVRADSVREFIGIHNSTEPLGWEDKIEFKNKKLTLETMDEQQVRELPYELKNTLTKKF